MFVWTMLLKKLLLFSFFWSDDTPRLELIGQRATYPPTPGQYACSCVHHHHRHHHKNRQQVETTLTRSGQPTEAGILKKKRGPQPYF